MSDNVTPFRPNTPMGEVTKAVENVLKVMKRHGMGSLLCQMGDFTVDIKPVPTSEKQT